MIDIGHLQKVTNALYKVTDFLEEQEPLKWILRNTALNILMNVIDLENKQNFTQKAEKLNVLRYALGGLEKIVHALSLAGSSGFISEINFEILKREYEKLKQALILMDTEKEEELLLENKPLIKEPTKDTPPSEAKKSSSIKNISKGQSNGHNMSDRKKKIIAFLRKNNWATVKEISAQFSSASLKTVQRDLAQLTAEGVLKKQGEKRWRKYNLSTR